jgi:hypothetical protein
LELLARFVVVDNNVEEVGVADFSLDVVVAVWTVVVSVVPAPCTYGTRRRTARDGRVS